MCTDNAAMVAAAGWWRLAHDGPSPLSLAADPNLGLGVRSLPDLAARPSHRWWLSRAEPGPQAGAPPGQSPA